MNHKRKKPKSSRAGCLLCKPHKHQANKHSERRKQKTQAQWEVAQWERAA